MPRLFFSGFSCHGSLGPVYIPFSLEVQLYTTSHQTVGDPPRGRLFRLPFVTSKTSCFLSRSSEKLFLPPARSILDELFVMIPFSQPGLQMKCLESGRSFFSCVDLIIRPISFLMPLLRLQGWGCFLKSRRQASVLLSPSSFLADGVFESFFPSRSIHIVRVSL